MTKIKTKIYIFLKIFFTYNFFSFFLGGGGTMAEPGLPSLRHWLHVGTELNFGMSKGQWPAFIFFPLVLGDMSYTGHPLVTLLVAWNLHQGIFLLVL
jgi:hypothetical protein